MPADIAPNLDRPLRSADGQGVPVRRRSARHVDRQSAQDRAVGPRTWATTSCTCPTTSARPAPVPDDDGDRPMATSTLRVGTFVLNAGVLPARAAGARRRRAARPVAAAGSTSVWVPDTSRRSSRRPSIPFPTAGERVDHLRHVTRVHGRAPARRADPDRRQRRPGAAHRRAAGRHHRADRRRPGAQRRTTIRWPTASRSCATPPATASTTWS